MEFLVTAIIAGSCLLAGLTIGYMSRNSKIDKLTADRDRANSRANKSVEALETYRRSAEDNVRQRAGGGWSSPTGRQPEARRSAHGTVRPMPRQYADHDLNDGPQMTPAPAYETYMYNPQMNEEPREEPRTEPAYEARTETYSAPDTGSSSYGGSDYGSGSSGSDSSSY